MILKKHVKILRNLINSYHPWISWFSVRRFDWNGYLFHRLQLLAKVDRNLRAADNKGQSEELSRHFFQASFKSLHKRLQNKLLVRDLAKADKLRESVYTLKKLKK